MSLQRFRYSLPKNLRLASVLKIVCTITPIGIAIRDHRQTILGGPVTLTAGMLATPLSVVLCTLASTLLSCLSDHSEHGPLDLKQPTNQSLADSLWLNCGYRICVHKQPSPSAYHC